MVSGTFSETAQGQNTQVALFLSRHLIGAFKKLLKMFTVSRWSPTFSSLLFLYHKSFFSFIPWRSTKTTPSYVYMHSFCMYICVQNIEMSQWFCDTRMDAFFLFILGLWNQSPGWNTGAHTQLGEATKHFYVSVFCLQNRENWSTFLILLLTSSLNDNCTCKVLPQC